MEKGRPHNTACNLASGEVDCRGGGRTPCSRQRFRLPVQRLSRFAATHLARHRGPSAGYPTCSCRGVPLFLRRPGQSNQLTETPPTVPPTNSAAGIGTPTTTRCRSKREAIFSGSGRRGPAPPAALTANSQRNVCRGIWWRFAATRQRGIFPILAARRRLGESLPCAVVHPPRSPRGGVAGDPGGSGISRARRLSGRGLRFRDRRFRRLLKRTIQRLQACNLPFNRLLSHRESLSLRPQPRSRNRGRVSRRRIRCVGLVR